MYAHAGWSVPCGELPAGLPRTRGPEAEALLTRAFLADLRRAAYTDRGGRRRRTTHCEAGDRLLKLLLECGAVGVQGRRDHADPLLVMAAARIRGDAARRKQGTRSAVLDHRTGSWPDETAFRLVHLRGLPAGWLRDFGTARRCSTTRAPSSRRCPSGRRCRSPATTPNGYGTSNAFSTGAQQVRYKKPDAIFFAGRGADLRGFVIANVGSALHRAGPSPTSQQALREARDPPTSASSTSTTGPSVARVTPSPRTARRLSATTRCGPGRRHPPGGRRRRLRHRQRRDPTDPAGRLHLRTGTHALAPPGHRFRRSQGVQLTDFTCQRQSCNVLPVAAKGPEGQETATRTEQALVA